jgi:hypothetical protein
MLYLMQRRQHVDHAASQAAIPDSNGMAWFPAATYPGTR